MVLSEHTLSVGSNGGLFVRIDPSIPEKSSIHAPMNKLDRVKFRLTRGVDDLRFEQALRGNLTMIEKSATRLFLIGSVMTLFGLKSVIPTLITTLGKGGCLGLGIIGAVPLGIGLFKYFRTRRTISELESMNRERLEGVAYLLSDKDDEKDSSTRMFQRVYQLYKECTGAEPLLLRKILEVSRLVSNSYFRVGSVEGPENSSRTVAAKFLLSRNELLFTMLKQIKSPTRENDAEIGNLLTKTNELARSYIKNEPGPIRLLFERLF